MGTGWNFRDNFNPVIRIITDWDMGTGWNPTCALVATTCIITDWDMGTGWNYHNSRVPVVVL